MLNEHPYKMSISLNVLNHLGIGLYSNIPAVLSEIVANAWDADAENVQIEVNNNDGEITDCRSVDFVPNSNPSRLLRYRRTATINKVW